MKNKAIQFAPPEGWSELEELWAQASDAELRELSRDDTFMEAMEKEMRQLDHLEEEVTEGLKELKELCQKMKT